MDDDEPVKPRRVLGVSGWVLAICLFLPALRVCGDPMMPVQFPPTYGIYAGAVLVALIAMAKTLDARRRGGAALLAIYYATVMILLAMWLGSANGAAGSSAAVAGLVLGFFVIRSAWRTPWSDRGVSLVCLLHGLLGTVWNGLLASDRDGMWGAWIGLVASAVMTVMSLVWLEDAHRAETERRSLDPVPLPVARVVSPSSGGDDGG